jgi:[acyl-carrier-protein] S-malonyltransferase
MGKIAFVFPGQGAQYSGMGLSLYENSNAAKAVFDELDKLRPGILDLCFYGNDEELADTKNTQPSIFACSMAAAYSLNEGGIKPDMVAGFSLGELCALTFAGSVSLGDGFLLVGRRAELMQAAAEVKESAMAAVLKLSNEEVDELCRKFPGVYPANYNCPGQVAVSGLKAALVPFYEAVKSAGGRAIPLKVRGGFHSPLMESAAEAFRRLLENREIAPPTLPLYANHTGYPYEKDFTDILSNQIMSPVRWEDTVRNMIKNGADTFFEVGPGSVLSGLIKKIDPTVKTFCVGTKEQLEIALKEYGVC